MFRSFYSRLVFLSLSIIAAVFPMAVYAAVSGASAFAVSQTVKDIVKFLHVMTMFYFVIFMPLIAFMLVLVVPFYVFRLQGVSDLVRVSLLALIVATLVFVAIQFLWLNINIDFVKQLYSLPTVWVFSWLVHVAIVLLIITPLVYEEEPLFISLVLSLVMIIVSANYVGYRFLSLLKVVAKN